MSDSGNVKVSVTAPHKYAGQWRFIGEEYECTELEARDLIAIGFATRAKVPAAPEATRPRTYKRRDMTPEED